MLFVGNGGVKELMYRMYWDENVFVVGSTINQSSNHVLIKFEP